MDMGSGGEPAKPNRIKNEAVSILLLAGLCLVAYLPAFNNGFISDDYVILGRLDPLRHDLLYLFAMPPECFRFTSYVCFGILRFLFSYHSVAYYAFNLLLHLINSILLWKLLTRITRSPQIAYLGAALFASAQGHQEAIMWLAAMNETLLGMGFLAFWLLWERGSAVWSGLIYAASLFSKESALVFVGLISLLEVRARGGIRFRGKYLVILVISAAFVALFLSVTADNFMLSHGSYSLSFHAVPVFLLSLHRLLFPWVYLAIVFHLVQHGKIIALKSAAWGVGFAAIALLPYIFLTYQNHVTSRQEYLASMGIAWSLAILVQDLGRPLVRRSFISLFIVANIGYIWIKDRQFEQRAAPTNRLIDQLKAHRPQDLAIIDFPANGWIAINTTRLVSGWRPEMIHVNPNAPGSNWLTLRWDPRNEKYDEVSRK